MTLILARVSADFALQVTDRLVSEQISGQPFDKVSNKNILFIATNAVVVLAFTGAAFIEGIPTDHWLAQQLAGIEIDPFDPPALKADPHLHNRDLGRSLLTVRDRLNQLRAEENPNILVAIHGWQWNSKRRLRPLAGSIERNTTDQGYAVLYSQRHWYLDGAQTISSPVANFSPTELRRLSVELRGKEAQDAQRCLVQTVRGVARRNPRVGPHCMSVLIPPPSNPNISVRYYPAASISLPASQQLSRDESQKAFSPWVLSTNICCPPSELTGAFVIRTGLFTIQVTSQTVFEPDQLPSVTGQIRRGLC
jgi:hypothetical protein